MPAKEMVHPPTKGSTDRGIIIVNIKKCASGAVEMGRMKQECTFWKQV
jgi:L-asparaginase/Glu-tRNA(Gln) amidotransferase subunit D